MKTVKFTLGTQSGNHGTNGNIYSDGTQCHYGDGRQGEDEYMPRVGRSAKVGMRATFVGPAEREITGTIAAITHHTTGATTVTITLA